MKLLAALALLALPTLAHAQNAPYPKVDIRDAVLSAAVLTATQTATLDLGAPARATSPAAYSKARVGITTTYGAATAVNVTFFCAMDSHGTRYVQQAARSISGGTSTLAPFADVIVAGAALTTMVEYDVRGCRKIKLQFTGSGTPTSSDTVTADVALIAGQ